MNLINELKAQSNKADNVKQEVINEIKEYFDKYLEEGLENYLRQKIGKTETTERKVFAKVDFWEYHAGCSDTYFYCCGKTWNNPENQYDYKSLEYKGVELRKIHTEICIYLTEKLIKRMEDLGFTLLEQNKQENRFKYFDIHFYFGW